LIRLTKLVYTRTRFFADEKLHKRGGAENRTGKIERDSPVGQKRFAHTEPTSAY
jgi:hypothetical protein